MALEMMAMQPYRYTISRIYLLLASRASAKWLLISRQTGERGTVNALIDIKIMAAEPGLLPAGDRDSLFIDESTSTYCGVFR